jgi:hypothetical protein
MVDAPAWISPPAKGSQRVVRTGRGGVGTSTRDECVEYVERTGVEEYPTTPGNRDA